MLADYHTSEAVFVYNLIHKGNFILQNNLVEIRSDSFKLLEMMKRPVPHMVGSIGAWMNIFQVQSFAPEHPSLSRVETGMYSNMLPQPIMLFSLLFSRLL